MTTVALEDILHPSLRDTGATDDVAVGFGADLDFYVDAAAPEGVNPGTEVAPWGPIEALENVRQKILEYPLIDKLAVFVDGAATLTIPSEPFDAGPFGQNGKIGIVGRDYVEVLPSMVLAAGTTNTRLVVPAISGGVSQYEDASIEVLTGASAGAKQLIRGHQKKRAVNVVSTANITLSAHQVIDGVNTGSSSSFRVLVAAQTNPVENGIYRPQAGAWIRAGDADRVPFLEDAMVPVTAGTTYAGTNWYQSANNPIPGTNAQTWSQNDTVITSAYTFSVTGNVVAGDTIRIIRPAAAIMLSTAGGVPGSSGNNFLSGIGKTRITADFSAGQSFLINLRVSTPGSSNFRVQGCRSNWIGVILDAGVNIQFANCNVVCAFTSSLNDLNWLGFSSVLKVQGWGCAFKKEINNLSTGGNLSGIFNALAGITIGHFLSCEMSHSGGRIAPLADPSGHSIITRSGFVGLTPNTDVVYDGGISARNQAYVGCVANFFVIINNTVGGEILHPMEGGRIDHRGAITGHAVYQNGALVIAGGRLIGQTSWPITGDTGDLRTQSKHIDRTRIEAIDTTAIVDDDGSIIARLPSVDQTVETIRLKVVLSKTTVTPPGSYNAGDCWAVPTTGASGEWSTYGGKLVQAVQSSATPGFTKWLVGDLTQDSYIGTTTVWVVDEQKLYVAGTSGLIDPSARNNIGTFTYNAARTLDVSEKPNWSMSDTMTGTMGLTLSNGVDGCTGVIDVIQDGGGGQKITGITVAGRTVKFAPSIGATLNTAAFLAVNARSRIGYEYVTTNGVAEVVISLIDGLAAAGYA